MTLQNVKKIKGAADKNGLKDVMCEQGLNCDYDCSSWLDTDIRVA